MAVYIDTSAWIALHEPKDRNHARARKALAGIISDNETLTCGWHTLVELADGLARHYDQATADRELARILASPRVKVEASEPHLPRALELLHERRAWDVDLSDCLSFALMEALGLRRAFTFDKDFGKPGYDLVG